MAGVPHTLELPADRPRPAVPSDRSIRAELAIDPGLAAAAKALGRSERATPFMSLLAVYAGVLGRLDGYR